MVFHKPKNLATGPMVAAVAIAWLWTVLQVGAAQPTKATSDRSSRKIVGLVVHAANRHGDVVPPNSLTGVEVTERGDKLQVVQGPEKDGLPRVALVLDANFHQRKVFRLERETAEALLSKFESKDAQGMVMSFGSRIHSSGALTDNWEALRTFNRSLDVETDEHNDIVLMFDSIRLAIEKLGDGPGTKAVILFAEGNDHGSSTGWQSLARLAQHNHTACYVVLFADHSFYGTKSIRRYGWDLVELSPQTGGKLWEAGNNSGKSTKITQEITRELNSQCLIEVLASPTPVDRFHVVRVTAAGYRLRAQTGYFN